MLRPAARVALAAAAVAVVAALLVVEATDKDHGQKTGTPSSQRGPKVGVDVTAGVRFSLEGRRLTVTLLAWAPTVPRNRVSDAPIRATCGINAQAGPEGNPATRRSATRLWPAGQDTLRFRFRGEISSSSAEWCRVDNPAVGYVGSVRFGTAPVSARGPEKRIETNIEQSANQWARLFAAGETCNPHMNQPACERAICTRNDPTDPPIRNCTLPSAEFRKSFRDARVEKIAIRGTRAAARFTNGATVELVNPKRADFWLIDKFGEHAGRGFFK